MKATYSYWRFGLTCVFLAGLFATLGYYFTADYILGGLK